MGSHPNNSSPSDDSCLIPPVEVKSSESSTKFTKEQDEKSLRDLMDTLHPPRSGRPKKSSGQSTPPTTNDAPPSTPESSSECLFEPQSELPDIPEGQDIAECARVLALCTLYNVRRLTYMAGRVDTQVKTYMEAGEIARLVNSSMKLRSQACTLAMKSIGDINAALKKKKESVEA